jgi:predicted nucleotide-binding protein
MLLLMSESAKGALRVVTSCETALPTAQWSPGEFYLEPSYRDLLEDLSPQLMKPTVRRYALGAKEEYQSACEAIERQVVQWRGANQSVLGVKGSPNPLAVVYRTLVRGGARLAPADGFGPLLLSDTEYRILEEVYEAMMKTGNWPLFRKLEGSLAAEGRLESLSDAIREMNPLVRTRQDNGEQRIALTLAGAALVPNAALLLKDATAIASTVAKEYIQRAQDEDARPNIALPDILARASIANASVRSLIRILQYESVLSMGWSSDLDPKNVYFSASSSLIPLSKVTTLTQLVARLYYPGLFVHVPTGFSSAFEATSRAPIPEEEYLLMMEDMTEDGQLLLAHLFDAETQANAGPQKFDPASIANTLKWTPHRLGSAVALLEELALLTRAKLMARSPFPYANMQLSERGRIVARRNPQAIIRTDQLRTGESMPDAKKVFIIHGRNIAARTAIEHFVRSLALDPIDFDQLAADQGGSPFIGDIVRSGLDKAQGIIALFTPEEFSSLRPEHRGSHEKAEYLQRWQARPNVIFEAGMAYGLARERTTIVTLGSDIALFSDVDGVHVVRLTNSVDSRRKLRQRLIGMKCEVDQRSDVWTDVGRSGDFEACIQHANAVTPRDPFRPQE